MEKTTLTIIIQLIVIVILFILLVINLKNKNEKLEKEEPKNENIETFEENLHDFNDITVKEIMTPRTSIFAFQKDCIIEDVIFEIKEQGFSRIPLYVESIDDISGILYVKDLLNVDMKEKLSKYLKQAIYVPETMKIYTLFEMFRTKQSHMAIIIDEYGGTSGIVTIEDIIEELLGEIRDEYDEEEEKVVKLANDVYEIKGDVAVEELDEILGISIPTSEEYDTISGYVQYKLGQVAKVNDKVSDKKYIIKVTEVENKRIKKLKIILLNIGGKNE